MKKITQQLITLTTASALVVTTAVLPVRAEEIQAPYDETGRVQTIGSEEVSTEKKNMEKPEDAAPPQTEETAGEPEKEESSSADQEVSSAKKEAPTEEKEASAEEKEALTEEEEAPFPFEKELEIEGDVDKFLERSIKGSRGSFTEVKIVPEGISLTWAKIDGAEGYYLERRRSGGTWKRIRKIPGMETLNYIDRKTAPEKTYYYRVKAYARAGSVVGMASASRKVIHIQPPALSTETASDGVQLRWSRMPKAKGYYVYRRQSPKEEWTKVYTISEPGEIAWRDTSAKNGIVYFYTVTAYNGDSESIYSNKRKCAKITRPRIKDLKRKSSAKLVLTWKANEAASGYQIRYARNSMFIGSKMTAVESGTASRYVLKGLRKNEEYYIKIRAYSRQNGKTYYSAWSASSNVRGTRTVQVRQLRRKNKVFELRSAAKQKLYQYDVLQGSCTDGKYSYYLLLNKTITMCKVVKVKHSTMKVKAVSEPLYVGHGNDMTYNKDKKCLVVAQSTGEDPKTLISINPKTLEIIENRHVYIPSKLAGGSKKDAKKISGFYGIAYNSSRKQYAALLRSSYNFVILDLEMRPVRYVKVSKKNNYLTQGIDATKDYIMVAQSPKEPGQIYNIITVYDWDGNYVSKIKVKAGYEIESIFHIGKKFYAGFYRSYLKPCYRTVVKTVTVNGVTRKRKVKERYDKFMRANYVYRIYGI